MPSLIPDKYCWVQLISLTSKEGLLVNQQVAVIATEYIKCLVLTGGLRRFATYFNSDVGAMRSRYICPDTLAEYHLI